MTITSAAKEVQVSSGEMGYLLSGFGVISISDSQKAKLNISDFVLLVSDDGKKEFAVVTNFHGNYVSVTRKEIHVMTADVECISRLRSEMTTVVNVRNIPGIIKYLHQEIVALTNEDTGHYETGMITDVEEFSGWKTLVLSRYDGDVNIPSCVSEVAKVRGVDKATRNQLRYRLTHFPTGIEVDGRKMSEFARQLCVPVSCNIGVIAREDGWYALNPNESANPYGKWQRVCTFLESPLDMPPQNFYVMHDIYGSAAIYKEQPLYGVLFQYQDQEEVVV